MEQQEYVKMYALEDSHWWFRAKRAIVSGHLRSIAPRGARILDVGCGTGIVIDSVKSIGPVYGLDYSSAALGFCRERGLSRLCQGSVTAIPFRDNSFDVVLCLDVLYHRGVSDDEAAMRELYRVLKPGGHALITDSALRILWSRHDHATHAARRYSTQELGAKLRKAGFFVEKLSYYNFFLFPLVFAVRKVQDMFSKKPASDVSRTPEPLNTFLYTIFSSEGFLLRHINLPIGVSVFCIAEKRG